MSARDAARQVLLEAGEPLHVREISKRMLAAKLWTSGSKTPEASVNSALAVDIKEKGDASSFVRVSPGVFALRDTGNKGERGGSKSRPAPQETYSFTDSAERVLQRFGDKQPLHYREITRIALEQGWLNTSGKTPEASMYAQILTEIRRYRRRGDEPRFVKHGRGFVGLTLWMGKGLAFQIEQHNRAVRKRLLKDLVALDSDAFEELVGRLLAELGFEDIEVTRRSGDGGIDVRGTLVVGDVIRTRMAIQAKCWKPKNRIQAPVVQQVRGSLGTHEQGLIITTSGFSSGAVKEAARPDAVPVALMNGEQLVALLVENEIGVSRRSHDILELDPPPDEEPEGGRSS